MGKKVDDGEIIEPAVNPRDAAMAEIAEQARQSRDDDQIASKDLARESGLFDDILDDEDDLAPVIVDNEDDTDDNPIVDHDGKQFLKLVVNGEDQEMSMDDAIARLQKGENADLQTTLAVEERKILQTKINELQADLAGQSTQPDDTEAKRAEKKQSIKDALQKLYDSGDVDGATELLLDAVADTPEAIDPVTPGMTANEVVDLLDRRDTVKSVRDAFKAFKGDEQFKAVVDDPDLMVIVDKETERLQNDQEFMATEPSYLDIFEKAGKIVQDKYLPAKEEIEDPVLTRKRKQPSAVASRTVRRQGAPDLKKPPTTHDTIEAIAKARGQTIG